MKIVAIMPVRNEAWVLGLSARAVLMWADELVVLDHYSMDETLQICDQLRSEYGDRFHKWTELNPVWEEMRHRQMLLDRARQRGATHVAIIDADEVLTGNLLANGPNGPATFGWRPGGPCPVIRDAFAAIGVGRVMQIPWLCLRGSINCVHTSGPWADGQNVSMGFQDAPELHWTSEKRGGYDFHHRNPMGKPFVPFRPITKRIAGLMHLQFVSDRRLRAKQALYKATEVLRWPDREPVHMVDQRYNLAVYDQYNSPGSNPDGAHVRGKSGTGPVDPAWWSPYAHLMEYFHPDAEPWQEAELKRLVKEHGRQRFAGLDLFGVV